MESKYDNSILYSKSIPRSMPMLPNDPRKTRIEFLITYMGHKQSVGFEVGLPPEEIRRLRDRCEQFLVQEIQMFNAKADIEEASARI